MKITLASSRPWIAGLFLWLPSLAFAAYQNPIRFSELPYAAEAGYRSTGVSADIVEMKILIERRNAKSFDLIKSYMDNPYIQQRAVEFLYPARLEQDAALVFAPIGTSPPDCREVDRERIVAIYECP